MRILQILPSLDSGGVETGTLDLAGKLVSQGHSAYCISAGGRLVPLLKEMGAVHYELPVNKKSLWTILPCIEKVAQIIKEQKIELVHARSRVPAWIAYFACRQAESRFITTCHGYYSKHFFSAVMGWGKVCIVPSRVIGNHMSVDFGVSEDKIQIIPRGVDLKKFPYNPKLRDKNEEFTVGIIARITPLKGHKYFLKAAAKLDRLIPNLKAIAAGSPPKKKEKYLDELLMLSRRLGLERCVEFCGDCQDIAQLLSKLDCLVMATTTPEAFGRVIIEAQAAGVPVVAARVGGIIDIIDDTKTGFLVDACDSEAIAQAVLKIYENPQLCLSIRKQAREKVEKNYSLDLMAERTRALYEKEIAEKNILIIKLGALGDIILSVPSLRAIRNKFEKARIFLLTDSKFKEAVAGCPYIDRFILLEKSNNVFLSILKTSKKLRHYNFDLVIDLQNNRASHMLAFLSGSFSRCGWDNGKLSFLLNHRQKWIKEKLDPVSHQQKFLELLDVPIKKRGLEIWVSEKDREYIDDFLKDNWLIPAQTLIGFNIASSKKWQSKRWPIDNFIKLAEELTQSVNARIVLTAVKEDAELCEYFIRNCRYKPINACGKTNFTQLSALIQHCKVYVSNDSAPLHIAVASEVPFVALFGPTDPKRHILPEAKGIVLHKDLRCSPCYKPFCRSLKCLKEISVEEVKSSVISLIPDAVNSTIVGTGRGLSDTGLGCETRGVK